MEHDIVQQTEPNVPLTLAKVHEAGVFAEAGSEDVGFEKKIVQPRATGDGSHELGDNLAALDFGKLGGLLRSPYVLAIGCVECHCPTRWPNCK